MIHLENVKFKLEYIPLTFLFIVSLVLLLKLITGLLSIKEAITFVLIIIFLAFLTIDIKRKTINKKSPNNAYMYVVLIFLFSYL
ncbi:hypothetical protein DET59_106197 [Rossellomorea aquimaris]|uniref:Uncharacterized protein n=1 Tax=Rossellomorea aquimaris TaxID=189382 RepID=A0A366ESF4_9BACI|nr:hypothetical protein DET59_106197 [Rossellomorea aquimaris]